MALYVRLFFIAVALNFVWEMAQSWLYEPMGAFWQATLRCFFASLGDAVLVVLIAVVAGVVFGSAYWFVDQRPGRYVLAAGMGLVAAIVVELWGLGSGRWAYGARMPLIRGIELGLVPLAQLVLLVPLTLWAAAKSHSGVSAMPR